MNVCQRNVACFVRVACRFDKILGFWMLGVIATLERLRRKR